MVAVLISSLPQSLCNMTCLHYSDKFELNKPLFDLSAKTSYLYAREAIAKHYPMSLPYEIKYCTPEIFFQVNRHANRYPKTSEIRKFRELTKALREHLLNSTNPIIPKEVKEKLQRWRFPYADNDDHHVSLTGFIETAKIGIDLIWFEFFSLFTLQAKSSITSIPSCWTFTPHDLVWPHLIWYEPPKLPMLISMVWLKNKSKFTPIAMVMKLNLQIVKLSNFRNFILNLISFAVIKETKFKQVELESMISHVGCKKIMLEKDPNTFNNIELEKFDTSTGMDNLVKVASKRLDGFRLKFSSLKLLYNVCQYEWALFANSVWCDLLTEADFKAMEYWYDWNDFHQSYRKYKKKVFRSNLIRNSCEKFPENQLYRL